MAHVRYIVVQHDNGWAYKVGDTVSQTYLTRTAAHEAAVAAAEEQRAGGETVDIQFETKDGEWKIEKSRGGDRPTTEVDD